MKIRRAMGIDLGTTNCAIATLCPQGDELVLYEDRFRRKTLPSLVGWDPGREQIVTGWEAWNRRVMTPTPVSSIKRKMGATQRVSVGPQEMLPQEVSAQLLARMKADMGAFMRDRADDDAEHEVTAAVITVPAYFDAPQIEATRQAGELAGLEVAGLLQEPTAAAMYYAWKHGIGDGTFLVYDLGGGTFDVSVIRCIMGEYQVLGLDGDNYLGGDDLDRRLAELLRQHLVAQGYALDLDVGAREEDAVRLKLLTRVAQEIKEALSTSPVQYVGRRDLFEDQAGNPVSIDMEVSREQFEALIEDLVTQTIRCCERALEHSQESAGVGLAQVEHVLLVGGSTRVPLVRARVEAAFCGPDKSLAAHAMSDEPDTCVALGAALHAANVAGLVLIDDTRAESPTQVTLTGALLTREAQARLVGRLEGPQLDAITTLALVDPSGDVAAIGRPERAEGATHFAMEGILLPDVGDHRFTLELCDAEGDALASVALTLRRVDPAAVWRSTGSALSNPTVLAKDITLEVVRDGRAERQTLLRHGTSLPAEGRYRFFTADRSGAVLLRLFQSRFPIRTIHLSVPADTPVGTPVALNLTIDESMTIVASGELLGQTFWAQIEPPPERELRDWQDVEQLLERAELVGQKLWGDEARYFREAADPLIAGIRETARTDPDKMQVLVSRLEALMDQFHQRDAELTPGYARYITLLDAIRRVVYRGDDALHLGLREQEWRQRLAQIEAQAEEAFQRRDQPTWGKVFSQVQAIWESLAQDESRFSRADDAEFAAKLALGLSFHLNELRALLADFSCSANPETRQLQQAELTRLSHEVEQKVGQPLQQLMSAGITAQHRHELERISESMRHVERQAERLPTLGLVRQ